MHSAIVADTPAVSKPALRRYGAVRRAFSGPAVVHPRSSYAVQQQGGEAQQRHGQRRRSSTVASAAAAPPSVQQTAGTQGPLPEASEHSQPSSSFDWFDHWFPIAFVKDIPDGQPYGFRLLDQPIVIWKDGEGRFRCLRDACPHRLVPLSDGRIAPNGELQCPYHGWQFKGCGTCTLMPQGVDPTAPRAAATAFQCAEKQGLVWVKLKPAPKDSSEPDTSGIHTLPELDDPDWLGFGDMWRDIPYDWATLIENVIDAGHVPFTHHGSVSKRQSSGMFDDMKILERGEYGFKGVWPTGPRKGGLGAQHTLFQGPVLMRHTIDAYDTRGFANITAVYGVPVAPGRCRAIVRQPFRFRNKIIPLFFKLSPAFLGHLGNNSVLDEDNIFLHMQEEESARRGMGVKPVGQVYYMPAASDAYVSGFRTWLASVAGGGPWGPMDLSYLRRAGPRLSEEQLLDHYHAHTKRCSICQQALRNVRLARVAAAVVGAAAAVAGVAALVAQWVAAGAPVPAWEAFAQSAAATQPQLHGLAAGCAAVAAVALLVWQWCHKTIPRFYQGERPFARNRVKGEYAA
ncbi:hypothetical protein ABPG77_010111 [Micractinium sp. CCAP 211/92]